jgi:hypothetical protein
VFELPVQNGRNQGNTMLIVIYTAEVVLLDYYGVYGAFPETFATVDTTVFNEMSLTVPDTKSLGRAYPDAQ